MEHARNIKLGGGGTTLRFRSACGLVSHSLDHVSFFSTTQARRPHPLLLPRKVPGKKITFDPPFFHTRQAHTHKKNTGEENNKENAFGRVTKVKGCCVGNNTQYVLSCLPENVGSFQPPPRRRNSRTGGEDSKFFLVVLWSLSQTKYVYRLQVQPSLPIRCSPAPGTQKKTVHPPCLKICQRLNRKATGPTNPSAHI